VIIYWCRKHGFCPIDGTLDNCKLQNFKRGCKNLIQLPTEHPKLPPRKYKRARHKRITLNAIRRAGL